MHTLVLISSFINWKSPKIFLLFLFVFPTADKYRDCVFFFFWDAFMASMMKTERFQFQTVGYFGGLPEICNIFLNWIDDIKDQENLQDASFYTLCAMFSLVSFLALVHCPFFFQDLPLGYTLIKRLSCFQVQLIRIQSRIPEYGWTTQKVFHLMNFLVALCKICFWFFLTILLEWITTTFTKHKLNLFIHSEGLDIWISQICISKN